MIRYVSWSTLAAYKAMHPSVKLSQDNLIAAQQAGLVDQDKANWRPVVKEGANAVAVKSAIRPK